MLVEMKRQEFESIGDMELIKVCIEPTLLQIRGKNPSLMSQIISQLTPGQQALCMFTVLHPEQSSEAEYYSWVSYLLEQPNYWMGVIGGLRFFSESSMIQLLEETKGILEASNREISLEDNLDLQTKITLFFERFQSIVPDSIKRISLYIRSNPQEFVQLKD
jgi:hypothetical protein